MNSGVQMKSATTPSSDIALERRRQCGVVSTSVRRSFRIQSSSGMVACFRVRGPVFRVQPRTQPRVLIPLIIPVNTIPCSGLMAFQYSRPIRPLGRNRATWTRVGDSPPEFRGGSMSNSRVAVPGKLHLRVEGESASGVGVQHPPEVQCVPECEFALVAATSAKAGAAEGILSMKPRILPEPVRRVVAVTSADDADGLVDRLRSPH